MNLFKKHYDVLISFAEEDIEVVSHIIESLRSLSRSYYFYKDENNTGKSLSSHTFEVYQKTRAYFGVCIVTENYKDSWADTELKTLIDRDNREKKFTLYLISINGAKHELVGNDTLYDCWTVKTTEDLHIQSERLAQHINKKIEILRRRQLIKALTVVCLLLLNVAIAYAYLKYTDNIPIRSQVYLQDACTEQPFKPAFNLSLGAIDKPVSLTTKDGYYLIKGFQRKDKGREINVQLHSPEYELLDSVYIIGQPQAPLRVVHKQGCRQRYTIRLLDKDNKVPEGIDKATLVLSDAVTGTDSVFAISRKGETVVQYRRQQGLSVSLTSDAYRLTSGSVSLDPGVNMVYVTPVSAPAKADPGYVVASILLNGNVYGTSQTLVNGQRVSALPGSGFTRRFIRLSRKQYDYDIALVQDDTCRVVADLRSYAKNDTIPLQAPCL